MPQILVDQENAAAFLERVGRDAEAAAFLEDRKADKTQQAMETATSEPESWLTVARKSVDFTAGAVCPAWELTAEERGELSLSVAQVLDHYFPGALAGFESWHPLAKLSGTCFFIAMTRFDLQALQFQPLHYQPKGDNNDDGKPGRRESDIDDGHDAVRKNGANATIGEG